MDEFNFDLKYYMRAVRDKKWFLIVPFVVILGVAATLALKLPAVYKSSGTILIESQEVPQEFIRTTVTGYVEERLQMISQVVMNRRNLLKLLEDHDPYPEARKKLTEGEMVELLRQDVRMSTIQAQTSGSGKATIAFTVSYENKNPRNAYAVTNELVSLYIGENLRMREEKTETTYDFLEAQLDELRVEVAELEAKIATFKEQNIRSLPELMELNLGTFNRLETDISNKKKQIQTLLDRKVYLQGQLASLESSGYGGPAGGALPIEEEIKLLRSRYLSERSSKSDTHPDVIKLRKQLDALEEEHGKQGTIRDKAQELEQARADLTALKGKYSEKHPSVIKLQKEVDILKREYDELAQQGGSTPRVEESLPATPAVINLQVQLQQTDLEIAAERESLIGLQRQYEDYRLRIEQTPRVEQAFRMLQRDYQVAQQKYQETLAKLQAAREARGLERSQAGEKLTIVDPPVMPSEPSKPNRPAIFFLGVVLAGACGVGSVFMAEVMDKRVRSEEQLVAITKLPLLTSIPVLETRTMRTKRRKRRVMYVAAAVLLMACALLAIHVFYRPLDILWISVTDRVERLMF